jgi:hypothetical protein
MKFNELEAEFPNYKSVWEWFVKNEKKRFVEASLLLSSEAIEILINRGMISKVYRAKAPGGYLLEGEYTSEDQFPKKLWDRDHSHRIPVSECEIVLGYRW